MNAKLFVVAVAVVLLVSCVSVPDKIDESFDLFGREHLYEKNIWSFSGRMSVAGENDAFTADIDWKHQFKEEVIKLSGAFGLGRTRLFLTKNSVEIYLDGKQVRHVGNVDDILSAELGIAVPVSALKYWVLGITDPGADYKEVARGFVQHGWKVTYLQMRANGNYELPRKIRVEQGRVKLKLIIGRWKI
jgi:outer membrane lipoprotein LolB